RKKRDAALKKEAKVLKSTYKTCSKEIKHLKKVIKTAHGAKKKQAMKKLVKAKAERVRVEKKITKVINIQTKQAKQSCKRIEKKIVKAKNATQRKKLMKKLAKKQ